MNLSLLVQAHRGAGFLDAENCLESIELGWSFGMVPEVDIATTRDGVIVGFHDQDLGRLVRDLPPALRGRTLGEADWSELRDLDVGTDGKPRRISAIAEVLVRLHAAPECRLYLDIKRVDFPALAALVRQHDVVGQVIFSTNRDEWIAAWRALLPGAETLRWLWMDPGATGLATAQATLGRLRADGFAGVTQLQLHILVDAAQALHPDAEVIRALADELRQRGLVFQAFPHCGDVAVYHRLLALGVRSFATDHPHEMLATLATWTP